MIEHTCGTAVPATVDDFVRHVAVCDETIAPLGVWARALVSRVDELAALDETPAVLPSVLQDTGETPAVAVDVLPPVSQDADKTRAVSQPMTTAEMVAARDAGASYRDIARDAGVWPETVRQRILRHKTGGAS